MQDLLSEVAEKHPDKRFIIYDSSEGDYANVYSVLFRQNEGAYLAGVYAGLMTDSGTIGILGGQNSTTINDYVVGTDSFHTPNELIESVVSFCEANGIKVAIDKPFAVTYVPLRYLGKDIRVSSIMIEANRGSYMN